MPEIRWTESGAVLTARWRSENGAPPPRRVRPADEALPAPVAYRLACEGTALLWRGDYQSARRLLRAMSRRVDRVPVPRGKTPAETFHLHRRARGHRARVLGMLLVPLGPDHGLALPRSPDVRRACEEAYGPADGSSVTSLRELLGVIGAHEWRRRGVEVPALGARIHPHYGVFSPVRGEYVDLVAAAPLPAAHDLAFDVGTGTGVLAALLARRGVGRVVATDADPRAVDCARDNIARLGLADRVAAVRADLFPPGRAPLIVFNPPWIPARPTSPLEHAVYDPDGRLLRRFLSGVPRHLTEGGEAWLILSDLAEHLALRTRADLREMFARSALRVVGTTSTTPRHPRAADPEDPLHPARSAETTTLWRLTLTP
ncbi:methyltransferase [Bailinhaonella thermotolerans]|uniref:Methyltransferase domain-containing protein n=1 Tax=Bailinhaonella thermotolerans TaxID=1070861 RepID=A0A3A4B0Z7_9ACTN|nr:methyltransferase [Bailinhaonella thermotolerans]RJL31763.1 methyltransferase domain-containing protein [Bailinhaonella thermotolerans]